jgi:hypothetical protein
MIAFLAEVLSAARLAWSEYRQGRELEEVKRDLRDRADVALDNAAAKERLAKRKASK